MECDVLLVLDVWAVGSEYDRLLELLALEEPLRLLLEPDDLLEPLACDDPLERDDPLDE